jgi:spermidine synthase
VLLPLHLLTFFAATMVCHTALAKDRPSPRHLTEFYLWMSVGGTLGGIFNALVAPMLFKSVAEYPIALVLAAVLLPRSEGVEGRNKQILDWVAPIGLALLTAGLVFGFQGAGITSGQLALALVFGVPVLLCYFCSRRPLRFGLGIAAILLVATLWKGEQGQLLHAERSFFGVHRVTVDSEGKYRQLVHGTTLHGRQSLDPVRAGEPLTYFTRTGPIGQLFAERGDRARTVGVVGLGVGSLASYSRPGQDWTFYEIDPAVRQIAENPAYFGFLAGSRAPIQMQMGDARLSLASARDGQYDVLVLDAYSSDSVPVHLLTREALALYVQKLAPGGILAFHISNQHLNLEPVLANLAQDAGLVCRNQEDGEITTDLLDQGKTPSQWMVLARREADFGGLNKDPRWQPGREDAAVGVWTDDFSSIFRVFLWR